MVGISFKRPVGPYADTKELEYIAALLQSGEKLRSDGTIGALDIVHFLSSRHGVEVSEEVVTNWIILELGGTPAPTPIPPKDPLSGLFQDEEESDLEFSPLKGREEPKDKDSDDGSRGEGNKQDDDNSQPPQQPYLDLCQLMSLLLIPFFRTGNKEENPLFAKNMIDDDDSSRMFAPQNEEEEHADLPDFDLHRREVLEQAMDLALRNILGAISDNNENDRSTNNRSAMRGREGIVLTTKKLRDLLEAFGEYNVPSEVLEEMILMAQSEGFQPEGNLMEVFLDKETFLHALTADTQLFDPRKIEKSRTTHFDDARKAKRRREKALFGKSHKLLRRRRKSVITAKWEDDMDYRRSLTSSKVKLPFKNVYMASNIDSTADTYWSTPWFIMVWVEAVLIYIAYMNVDDTQANNPDDPCSQLAETTETETEEEPFFQSFLKRLFASEETEDANFGQKVAASVVSWVLVVLMCMTFGFGWIFIASLGNATHPTEHCMAKVTTTSRLLLGMTVVSLVTVVTFFTESQTPPYDTQGSPYLEEINVPDWNTCQEEHKAPAYWAAFIGGLVILTFQLLRLLGLGINLGPLEIGGMEKKERKTKAAASFKVFSMVENAVVLHVVPPSLNRSKISKTFLRTAATLHTSTMDLLQDSHPNGKESNAGTTTDKALLNFHHVQGLRERVGGIFWTINQFRKGKLASKEGVFFHGRLMAINFVQYFVVALMIGWYIQSLTLFDKVLGKQDDGCIFTFGKDMELQIFDPFWNVTLDGFTNVYNINATHFSLFGVDIIAGQFPKTNGTHFSWGSVYSSQICYDMDVERGLQLLNSIREDTNIEYLATTQTELNAQNEIIDMLGVRNLRIPFIVNATAISINAAATQNEIIEALDLEEWQWKAALSIALTGAIVGTIGIACVFLPSFVSSVLKYRSGVLPSLKDDTGTFIEFRRYPDQTSILFGANFWGCFYTAAFCFILFGLTSFLCFYTKTRPYVWTLIAEVTGVVVTLVLHYVVIMNLLRGRFYSALYRKRPAQSNIMNVVIECWSLATSILMIGVRLIKLILVSALYVGRIDTPMLAPGVGYIAGAPLDPAPFAFQIDLLSHDAHRHPYIERLGMLYLLKLYNGKEFGSRAGAYWRILFVLAVMPWMRNYRVHPDDGRSKENEEDSLTSFSQSQQFDPTRMSVGSTHFFSVTEEPDEEDEDEPEKPENIMRLEMKLAQRRYENIKKQNKDLKAALHTSREKVRELKQHRKDLKHENKGLKKKLADD